MHTTPQAGMFERSQAEFKKIRGLVIEYGDKTKTFRVEGLPNQFHFNLTDGTKHMTVKSVCHNLDAGPHDGKDPGFKVIWPSGNMTRYLAVPAKAGLAWKVLDSGSNPAEVYSEFEFIESLISLFA